ncbi:hypothetical protein [Clostridium sp.]|jgi:hypothetical protein|uniref:hypothetical protein n=1 Tax=Clostridium sp. TaxID=1506 RepID=UPI0025BD7D73|nr:hypothetical protein [Clostridium sp.]MCI9069253.1 hypothetical protein [Clostridium sp.]MCI9304823.1 hypothetical protein [Clostridium sp.]
MSTKDKFIELAEEAIEIIKEVINDTKEENQLVDVNYVDCGRAISFTLKNNKTVEYSLSELGYIFKDDLEGFEIFSIKRFRESYIKLNNIQSQTEAL